MAKDKSLAKAVNREVKEAKTEASTGNEQTIKQGPDTLKEAAKEPADLPTNARSHLNP
jgi:hypothetical protein